MKKSKLEIKDFLEEKERWSLRLRLASIMFHYSMSVGAKTKTIFHSS